MEANKWLVIMTLIDLGILVLLTIDVCLTHQMLIESGAHKKKDCGCSSRSNLYAVS